jgi:hypothetical protein
MRFSAAAALLLVSLCCGTSPGDIVVDVDEFNLGEFTRTLDTVLPSGVSAGKLLKHSADFQAAIEAFRQDKYDAALKSLEKTRNALSNCLRQR